MAVLPEFTPDHIRQLVKEHGLTDYVDASERSPTQPGVYLCKTVGLVDSRELFSRFDGKNWSYGYSSPEAAAEANCLSYLSKPGNVTRFWRGLASDPTVPVVKTTRTKGAITINVQSKP